jgi:hypothetical protein
MVQVHIFCLDLECVDFRRIAIDCSFHHNINIMPLPIMSIPAFRYDMCTKLLYVIFFLSYLITIIVARYSSWKMRRPQHLVPDLSTNGPLRLRSLQCHPDCACNPPPRVWFMPRIKTCLAAQRRQQIVNWNRSYATSSTNSNIGKLLGKCIRFSEELEHERLSRSSFHPKIVLVLPNLC